MIGIYYRNAKLFGSWTIRIVTLALPAARVQAMLAPGLELGPQHLTAPGTHPVRLYFASPMTLMTAGFPPELMGMNDYLEHVVGIPFVHRSFSPLPGAEHGPYYYMPRLMLDNWGSALGGNTFWAFEKVLVDIETGPQHFGMRDLHDGRPLLDCTWQPLDEYRPVHAMPNFEPSFHVMNQPLVFRTLWTANFSMDWTSAMVRSIRARVDIYEPYAPCMPCGRFDAGPLCCSVTGAHEMRVSWTTSMPYYPELRPMLQRFGAELY